MLKTLLAHPLTRGLDLDDPATTALRRRIIREKPMLRDVYTEWYRGIAAALPDGPGQVLELGAGAGFLPEFVPGLINSEMFITPGIRLVADGLHLPFAGGSLRGIVMTNVLHHLPDARRFLDGAALAVRPGGVIVMVEPWVTTWSRIVYGRLHHEPFEPDAPSWDFPSSGPLSGANGALPWMMFERDRSVFEAQFPQWAIETITPFMPFRYLLSGGVSLRSLVPGWSRAWWRLAERSFDGWTSTLGMFAKIVLRRTGYDPGRQR